jgi:hypothetical protein
VIAAGADGEATLTRIEPLPPLTAPHTRSAPPPVTDGRSHHGSILVSAAPLALFGVLVAAAIFLFDRPGSAVVPVIVPGAQAPAVALPPAEPPPALPAPAASQPVTRPPAPIAPKGRPPRAVPSQPVAAPVEPEPRPPEPESLADEPVFEAEPPISGGQAPDAGPATLAVTFEHALEGGRFTLLIDGEMVVTEPIEPFEGRRRSPRRSFLRSVSVGAGHHVVAAIVEDHKGKLWREETIVAVEPGSTGNLAIVLRGALMKRLRIERQD